MSEWAAVQDRRVRMVLAGMMALSATVAVLVLVSSLGRPLGDMHAFRQSQTAIAVYWMLHGGPWLDYWTPVLGAPWSAPFEFPLFQWIVAVSVILTGMPISDAGRVVGFLWLIAGLVPAKLLFDHFRLPPASFLFYAILLLASPLYLYWGRAFLIETQALTLCLAFLLYCSRFLARSGPRDGLAATAFGIVAGLTKITTLLPFLGAAGIVALLELHGHPRLRDRGAIVVKLVVACLPALVLFEIWNAHADALKSHNPLAALLRSDALIQWNFGTLAQRFSRSLAKANSRALFDLFGLGYPLILPWLAWTATRARLPQRVRLFVALTVALYALPWLVLTNLHIVHNYYQCANGLFLLAGVAAVLGALVTCGRQRLAAAICIALVLSQYARFATKFAPALLAMPKTQRERAIAQVLRARTAPGSVVAIYGLDWSPFVPYQAERRARMEPNWTTPAQYRPRLPEPGEIVDGQPVSALVRCPAPQDRDPIVQARLARFAIGTRVVAVGDCRVYLRPRA